MFFKTRLQVAGKAKVTWKQNVLRHSFISYRLAELQNINQVALEAGNSPKMIHRHYRELATPEQAKSATPEIAPCLALGAFAGLRSEEILRLEWKDVTKRPGFIEVAADKAKTAARRLVPITNNLALWLSASPADEGLLWKDTKAMFFKIRLQVAAKAKVTWKQNVLRHSFISYRLAELQNINQVALEAGDSPKMIHQHYRELATPEQAKSWFKITPDVAENVVPMNVSQM